MKDEFLARFNKIGKEKSIQTPLHLSDFHIFKWQNKMCVVSEVTNTSPHTKTLYCKQTF
jgi:hypothetical protein